MKLKCAKALSTGVLLAAALHTASAGAATITFEEFPAQDELQGAGNTVFSKGWTFQYLPAAGEPYPVGFTLVGKVWRFNGRSTALLSNSCSAQTTLTRQDNNPFSLKSIDLAEANGDSGVSVQFVGWRTDGTQVVKDVVLSARKRWETVRFPQEFRDLQSVSWLQGDCAANPPHMFDNVRVYRFDQADMQDD